ncbi:MAG: Gfo/Idh/MocA family oxidoreductase [Candidatus Latescibacteria bacterium]|nr:Gfo/Idh/MocA family oxidoreductase [Candidatus Latescibacterota bacterium]
MALTTRWGILGTGWIAQKFATGLRVLSDAELVAVGSRTEATAHAFADQFGAPRRHASYEALAHDPDVDVVYVSTPHSLHKDNTVLCLNAGKPVLCEKPFTINARETETLIACARERKLFLMEAMWTRYLPIIVQARQWLSDGTIGEVRMVEVDFGFRAEFNPASRLFDPALGGGALLDIGIYTVSLASMVFGGPPTRIAGMAHLGATGVDEQSAMILGYGRGELAILSCAVRTHTPQEACIIGTEGFIKIHSPFWCATTATLSVSGQDEQRVEMPHTGNGYNYEAEEVMRCLRAGALESEVMPLDESLSIVRTMDQVRAQWGLRYPMEAVTSDQ